MTNDVSRVGANKTDVDGFLYRLIGVVGQPIAENPTGIMMEAAFAALGLQWRYLLIEGGPESLSDIVAGMKALRFVGANFTVPHKVAIIDHLDGLSDSARLIGAVNTVRIEDDGRWVGENTDGRGFMMALDDAGVDAAGKHVALLGAGGAARAIGVELVLAGAAQITVVNRSPERGHGLVETLRNAGAADINFVRWSEMYHVPQETDILVQATSIGLGAPNDLPHVNISSIGSQMFVCDVIPNPPQTALLKAAAAQGAGTMDGLSMIVNQAVLALKMWSGKDGDPAIMREALEKGLGLAT